MHFPLAPTIADALLATADLFVGPLVVVTSCAAAALVTVGVVALAGRGKGGSVHTGDLTGE